MAEFTVSANVEVNGAQQASNNLKNVSQSAQQAGQAAQQAGRQGAADISLIGQAGQQAGQKVKQGAAEGQQAIHDLGNAGQQIQTDLSNTGNIGQHSFLTIGQAAEQAAKEIETAINKSTVANVADLGKLTDSFDQLSAAIDYARAAVQEYEKERRSFDRYGLRLVSMAEKDKRIADVGDITALSTLSGDDLTAAQKKLIDAELKYETILKSLALVATGTGNSVEAMAEQIGKAINKGGSEWEKMLELLTTNADELKAFGAEVSETGEILVNTEENAAKAVNAVKEFAEFKFGDAFNEEADKVTKATQNASESVGTFQKSMGEIFAPFEAAYQNFISLVFDTLQRMPAGFKGVTAAVIGVVGAIGTAVTAGKALAAVGITVQGAWAVLPGILGAIAVAAVYAGGKIKEMETQALAAADMIKTTAEKDAELLRKSRELSENGIADIQKVYKEKGAAGLKELFKNAGWNQNDADRFLLQLQGYRKRLQSEVNSLKAEIDDLSDFWSGDKKDQKRQALKARADYLRTIDADIAAIEATGAKAIRKTEKKEDSKVQTATKALEGNLKKGIQGAFKTAAADLIKQQQEESARLIKQAADEAAALNDLTAQQIKSIQIRMAEIEKKPNRSEKDIKEYYRLQKQLQKLETDLISRSYDTRAKSLEADGTAYKNLMAAKQIAIKNLLSQEKKLEQQQQTAAQKEQTALEKQIELIEKRYKILRDGLPEKSEQAKQLKSAEEWEKTALKQLQSDKLPESVRKMTTKQYREEQQKIYNEFKEQIQELGLNKNDAAYTSLQRARDARLAALGEQYRTGVNAYEPKATQEARIAGQTGLQSFNDILKSGAQELQQNVNALAAALKLPGGSSSDLTAAGSPNTSNSYNININGQQVNADYDARQIAQSAANLINRQQENNAFFGGSYQQ